MDNFELILCIVNTGFSEAAMDAARKYGAKGGTTMHGRGTASKEAEKIGVDGLLIVSPFNITIQPEKEIIMILATSKIKDQIMKGLYDAVGVNTPAQGIAFSLPVDDVIGIAPSSNKNGDK